MNLNPIPFLLEHPFNTVLLVFLIINFLSEMFFRRDREKMQTFITWLSMVMPHWLFLHELFHHLGGNITGRKSVVVLYDFDTYCPFYVNFGRDRPTAREAFISCNAPALLIPIVFFVGPLIPESLVGETFYSLYYYYLLGMLSTSSLRDYLGWANDKRQGRYITQEQKKQRND